MSLSTFIVLPHLSWLDIKNEATVFLHTGTLRWAFSNKWVTVLLVHNPKRGLLLMWTCVDTSKFTQRRWTAMQLDGFGGKNNKSHRATWQPLYVFVSMTTEEKVKWETHTVNSPGFATVQFSLEENFFASPPSPPLSKGTAWIPLRSPVYCFDARVRVTVWVSRSSSL